MSTEGIPLRQRAGYRETKDHALIKALWKLREEHGLVGAVLISFTADHVAVNSSGKTDEFGAAMERLGDQILAAIDNGHFNPEGS
jgi:hypothetical protein